MHKGYFEQNLEGSDVARRNRYRELESMMMKIFAGDAVAFLLYIIFAGKGWNAVKIIAAVVVLLVSVFALVWLFIVKEMFRRRSLWMVTGFGAILICLLVSLVLKYPCPPVVSGLADLPAAAATLPTVTP